MSYIYLPLTGAGITRECNYHSASRTSYSSILVDRNSNLPRGWRQVQAPSREQFCMTVSVEVSYIDVFKSHAFIPDGIFQNIRRKCPLS